MVYIRGSGESATRFAWVKAPTSDELTQLTQTIAQRIARYLERQGLLVRDADNSYLTADAVDSANDDPMHQLLDHSITSATAPALLYLLHPCSRTASPWDHSRGVRCLPCKLCPIADQTIQ